MAPPQSFYRVRLEKCLCEEVSHWCSVAVQESKQRAITTIGLKRCLETLKNWRLHLHPFLSGHRFQGGEPGVGVLVQTRLPLPVPQQHLPTVVPLQALPLPQIEETAEDLFRNLLDNITDCSAERSHCCNASGWARVTCSLGTDSASSPLRRKDKKL